MISNTGTVFAFILLQQSLISGLKIEIEFLEDYLHDSNDAITINTCWKNRDLQLLSALLLNGKFAIFRKATQSNFLSYLSHDNLFVLDMNDCEESWKLLQEINERSLFRFPLKYLLIIDHNSLSDLAELLQRFAIYPTTQLLIAAKSDSRFRLHQPYRIHERSQIVWEDSGSWSLDEGLKDRLKSIPITARRFNLQQMDLTLTMFIGDNDTWNHLDDFRFPRVDTFTKQNYNTMRSFVDYTNVNATWISKSVWGNYDATTDRWSGLLADVYHGRAQISGSLMFITKDRLDYLDFIRMQNPLEVRFLLKKPPLSYTINIYFSAFRLTVWLSILIVTLLFALALFVILNVEGAGERARFTTSDIALILLEAVCQQGTATEPKSLAGRIIAFVLFTAFMFVYVSYSAYIVVLLQSNFELKSTGDLLHSRFECGALNTTYMPIYLQSAKEPIKKALNEKKIGPRGYYPIDVGMRRVRAGLFAFHVELTVAYDYVARKFTNYEVCALQELEGYLEHRVGHAFVAKRSPYKEIFKVALYRTDEHGLQRRNNRRLSVRPRCASQGGTFASVGMIDCYVMLLILFIGAFTSLIVLMVERRTFRSN